jgi:hypothetical protein
MAVGFPTKANWAAGDVLTASAQDDLAGTVNLLSNASAATGSQLVSNVAGSSFAYQPTPSASNPVLNAAANVWQRGTSVAFAGSAAGAYSADRWYIGGTNANQALTISRQATGDTTNLPFIQYAIRCQKNSGQTGNGALSIGQSFETVNSVPFAGKTVTLSFYARAGANYSPTSSALLYKLVTGTGTDQNVQVTGYTGSADTISTTATLTTTWQRFTTTATIPATTTEIAVNFNWTTTGTAGTNDYFDYTGVQIDIGSVALPFRTYAATYQGELAACQRYFYRPPLGATISPYGSAFSTTGVRTVVPMPVTMRVIPTLVVTGNLYASDGQNASLALSSLTVGGTVNVNMIQLDATVSSATQYRPYYWNPDGSSTLAFNGEL